MNRDFCRRLQKYIISLVLLMAAATLAYTAEQYMQDVQSGEQVACKWVKLAVKRHLDDLERVGNPDFPYYFDETQARRVIDFKQQLRHTQGEWANPRQHDTRFRMEPWQQFIDWVRFGWRRPGGCRRFTRSYTCVGRKNGKTMSGAATANYCFFVDSPREIGPEVYFVATKRDQAKKAWSEADRQYQKHPFLKKKARTYKQSSTIVVPGTAALMRTLGKDSKTEDALNPHFVLVDEYHAHPDNSLLEVMESGMAAREQPLIDIITTAGFDKQSACYQEEHLQAEKVLERSLEPVPEHFFCIMYTLDEEDDWTDPAVWIKANPNLGVSVRWQYLEERINDALTTPQKQNKIKTKNLNIWTEAETRWIKDDTWKACDFEVQPEDLVFQPCFFTMVPIFQRYSGMAIATDTFEKKVLAREIAHGGNPIMTWMIACTEVKSDRQGNIMPMKPQRDKTGKRIDGVVASIMGLHRAVMDAEPNKVEVWAV